MTMSTSSCRSGRPPEPASRQRGRGLNPAAYREGALLTDLRITDLRSYAYLDVTFPPGPILIFGPNASGKTSLLEAIVLAARGRSPRSSTDAEIIRFGADLLRIEARVASSAQGDATAVLELAIVRPGAKAGWQGNRKRVRVNGIGRRIAALGTWVRVVLFAPEDMLLVGGAPSLRRGMIDELASAVRPAYSADLASYGRALAQRNSLLRAIREEVTGRADLRMWDKPFLDAGASIMEQRLELIAEIGRPLADAHAEIAPEEAATASLGVRYESNARSDPAESVRDALGRRLAETADKEVWNGATLIGPHRDDVVFTLGGRDLASYGSRGQQRTAILAMKLAEIDILTAHDGRPPLLLLDDVFSELDVERRSHLVRRLTSLPQAFVTTTTPADLDPHLVARATTYEVVPGTDEAGASLRGAGVRTAHP
ncbi:MAG TPA: DNA replication/repair protein RecF [Candidatus Limnocylindrales bacterium]|nr:DNA replication/repair protein RecF [Candidatus Limnocylindrales bacterium]